MARGNVFGGLNSGGSNIKSVQRGEAIINNTSSLNIPISAVNLNKAIVKIATYAEGTTFQGASSRCIKAKLTTSTNLNLSVNESSAVNTYVSWEVVEFENVKSVQRGDVAVSNNILRSVVISTVNTTKSLLFISHTVSGSETTGYVMEGEIASSTTLEFMCGAASNVHWQVIEFN